MTTLAPPPVAAAPAPSAVPTPARAGATRDRYIDTLRAVALVRVVTFHTFSWLWLPYLFPSMGVMFALGGSLVAASLDRAPHGHYQLIARRLRRLLPPLWAYGLVVVPLMLALGWTWNETVGDELSWKTMLFWLLPLSTPPGSAEGADWVLPLWYVRTYLWLLVLSPAALWLFRHWPKQTLAVPLALVTLYSIGFVDLPDRAGDVVLSLAMFAACWMLGFAHHDGLIRRVPMAKIVALALGCIAVGVGWAMRYPTADGANIDDIPFANAFYCLGAVLLLLRFYPDFSWMTRHPFVDRLVTMLNSRAMTIYLWGNLAITGGLLALDELPGLRDRVGDGVLSLVVAYVIAWGLIGLAMVAFGWVEDVAARRRIRINPWPARSGALPGPAPAPARTRFAVRRPVLLLGATGVLLASGTAVSYALMHDTHTQSQSLGEAPVARDDAAVARRAAVQEQATRSAHGDVSRMVARISSVAGVDIPVPEAPAARTTHSATPTGTGTAEATAPGTPGSSATPSANGPTTGVAPSADVPVSPAGMPVPSVSVPGPSAAPSPLATPSARPTATQPSPRPTSTVPSARPTATVPSARPTSTPPVPRPTTAPTPAPRPTASTRPTPAPTTARPAPRPTPSRTVVRPRPPAVTPTTPPSAVTPSAPVVAPTAPAPAVVPSADASGPAATAARGTGRPADKPVPPGQAKKSARATPAG